MIETDISSSQEIIWGQDLNFQDNEKLSAETMKTGCDNTRGDMLTFVDGNTIARAKKFPASSAKLLGSSNPNSLAHSSDSELKGKPLTPFSREERETCQYR